jgi:suppressor for copper-sensitivity B
LNRIDVVKRLADLKAVALKADKTQKSPDIDQLLLELGNAGRVIPFYAIYPGRGGEPITFGGLISQQRILDALEQAGPSR